MSPDYIPKCHWHYFTMFISAFEEFTGKDAIIHTSKFGVDNNIRSSSIIMRFYTNVQMVGDHFLVRGYENGRHFATREKFYPTLFVPSNKETKYKTLEGDYVESIDPGTVRDCREFIKKYDGVQNFKVYGNDRYIYQYISEMYPEEEVKFDTTKIKISTIDIEVKTENGFPDVESAAEEVLLITVQDYTTKQIRTWGQGSIQ